MMDLLATKFSIELTWLLALGAGWFFMVWLFVLLLIILMSTPALAFLKAKIKKVPLTKVNYRDGICSLIVGDRSGESFLRAKGKGAFDMVEGSQTREKVSGVAIYEVFAENATTIPVEYAAILQELRESGFKINKFADLDNLIQLSGDLEKQAKKRKDLNEKQREEFDALIDRLKNYKVELKPYKTYKVHELANMFPYDMNPAFVEEYAVVETTRQAKQQKFNTQLLLYGGVATFILVIAAFIAYRFLQGDPQPAQITLQVTQDMLQSNTTRVINV